MEDKTITRDEFDALKLRCDEVAAQNEVLAGEVRKLKSDHLALTHSVDERFKVAGPIAPHAVREICHDCGSPAHKTGACKV